MNTYAGNKPKNESNAVANNQCKQQGGDKATVQFVDKRLEATMQRKLQGMANNSGRVNSMKPCRSSAAGFPKVMTPCRSSAAGFPKAMKPPRSSAASFLYTGKPCRTAAAAFPIKKTLKTAILSPRR